MPALTGMLNKKARKYKSAITIHADAKSANVLRLTALGVKHGDTVQVTIEGEGGDAATPVAGGVLQSQLLM